MAQEFTSFFNNLPVPAVMFHMKDHRQACLVNPAFSKAFGYSAEDIPNLEDFAKQAFPELEHKDTIRARVLANIGANSQKKSNMSSSVYRMIDKSGKEHNTSIGIAPQDDHLLMTFQAQTGVFHRNMALDADLRAVEKIAYALTENMPGGAYTMVLRPGEEMAHFSFLSTKFLKMLDLDRDAVIADPMKGFACVHPDDLDQWVAWNSEAFRHMAPFSHETRVIVRGEVRWIRAESVPRRLDDGSVIWEGVLIDITRLKSTEAQLQSVLKAARAFTWKCDLDKSEPEFVGHWETYPDHRLSERDMRNDGWLQTVHPDHIDEVRQKIHAIEVGLVENDILTYLHKVRENEWIWLQVHAGVSERDETGKPTELTGVSFNITADMRCRNRAHPENHRGALIDEVW